MTPLAPLVKREKMELRIEKENVKLGLSRGQFLRGRSTRRQVRKVKFDEMDVRIAGNFLQVFHGGCCFFFVA